ncbi:type III secretion system protein PrgF [Carnobacterium maltaromaticum]|uniref:type III secretion system protein PrgF n=1 Tax=Carnobacterium maltaromaticum TaxID=2751 RepID=UPI000E72CF2F|nr:type III secretion system protein PrgF [Carnobacterium maltaromaticum]AOA04144.1 type III secretion system protein PrgF [Carnobacterium maltaromaticum]
MDMIGKIVTLIGAIIAVSAAISLMFGIKDIRSGMADEDSRTLNKGIEKIVVGGATLVAIGGIVAFVLVQVNAITF